MVVHEPGDWLAESLQGLAMQDYANLQSLVLITGDEGHELSGEISDRVATDLPSAVVRFLGTNPGYGAACNSVLQLVQGDSGFFCFLHDDVALAPDAISRLVDEMYRSNAGAVGPKLVYWDYPQMIQSVGIDVDKFGVPLPIAEDGELDQEQHDAVRDVFVLSGACLMVRADLFRTVGGFNPDLAVVGADVDLCWRLHATAARVVIVPSAVARHRETATRALDGDEIFDTNLETEITRIRTVASATSLSHVPFVLAQMVLLAIARCFILVPTGRAKLALIELRALAALPFAVGEIKTRREAIAAHRIVDGDEVHALQLRGSSYVTSFFRRRAQAAGVAQAQAVGNVREATPRSAYVLWISLALIVIVGSRSLFLHGVASVGQMAPITAGGRQLLASYASGWWSAGFGQVSALPTGIALMASGAVATLGHMGLFHTLTIVLLPLVGWLGVWRFASVLGTRAARISAVACYAAVPLPYAAISSGRWGALLVYATIPWIVHLARMLVGHADLDEQRDSEPMVHVVAWRWRKWFASLA
ncbi:MAG: glycosyltransferase, partial [Actinobacteria bacterium]|nr:glycosyltransferase [Actinomycetota bacterium]